MCAVKTIHETWSPETSHDRQIVLVELECVLASPHFCNSKRYPALLRYIVEHALEDKSDSIKERTLGVEVFHRPADYDTSTDTIVRYTAGEVRKRLSLYYHEHSTTAGVQISLPVGSYAPEFLKKHESEAVTTIQPQDLVPSFLDQLAQSIVKDEARFAAVPAQKISKIWLLAAASAMSLVLCGLLAWRLSVRSQTALNQFWQPAIMGAGEPLLCVGGNVLRSDVRSGTQTAEKDIEYPFVSMQLAAGMLSVAQVLGRNGGHYQFKASSSTPLNDLSHRPLILMGAYNNIWTMRLTQALRFHFTEPGFAIVDGNTPNRQWTRDRTKPYSDSDDYAIVARFHDTTTGSTVFVIAGLGRNGTEAASQFALDPNSMQTLKNRLGGKFANGNIEVVLKMNVIDGKTGSPSIEDAYGW
jgi:hypothetical protein